MLILFMNVNLYMGSILVCSVAIRSAFNYALRMLGYPGKRAEIMTYKGQLKTLTPTILPFSLPSGVCMNHRCKRIGNLEDKGRIIVVMVNGKAGVGEYDWW